MPNKKCNVFTPLNISTIMNSYLSKSGSLLDPAVGIGNLLKDTDKYSEVDVYDTEKQYLDTIDDTSLNNITKHNMDFLKEDISKTYDNIIMNPPYIRIQDMETEYISFLKQTFPLLTGNTDIYLAFILKCLTLLDENGTFVSVHPNSILYNKGSRETMKFLIQNRYIRKIIDYNSEKIFKNINVYCCIMVFDKREKEFLTYNDKEIAYNTISSSLFERDTQNTLSSHIKTYHGIATLCDEIFIHDEKLFNEQCWRKVFKVSRNQTRYIIFPYHNGKIIPENKFKQENPKTFEYLCTHRNRLSQRDRGKKKYEEWYAFGRKQGIKEYPDKDVLYIPTMSDVNFRIYRQSFSLFYSGICIHSVSDDKLDSVFNSIDKGRQYLSSISSKRGSNWFNISSTNLQKLVFEENL